MKQINETEFRQLCDEAAKAFEHTPAAPTEVFESLMYRLLEFLGIPLEGHIRAAASGLEEESRFKTMILHIVLEHDSGEAFEVNPIMDELGRKLNLDGYLGPNIVMDSHGR